jgi:NAD(P)-dependent dehydrogenase (short-subunit alcohol dehydrogenase family)
MPRGLEAPVAVLKQHSLRRESLMKQLEGKVAVVTGGNSGIGLATAQSFVDAGATVVIVGRRADAVDAALARLGGRATGVVGDIADLATHDRLAAHITRTHGRIDIYVANAGMAVLEPSSAVTPEGFDAHFATNTRGVFFGVTKAMPLMADGGAIVLISSIAGTKYMENHVVYAGSKAAIEAFARSWSVELKDRRIRVNVISPGPVDTPILEKLGVDLLHKAEFEKTVSAAIPLGRFGRPEELARAALFLASEESSFITGVNLLVDGGMSLL